MSKTAYTPGPWRLDYHALGADYFSPTKKRNYRYVCGVEFAESMAERERKANAALIAAAPSLYAAAQQAMLALQDNYDKYDNCEWHSPDQRDAYIALRDAVSIAKGGRT